MLGFCGVTQISGAITLTVTRNPCGRGEQSGNHSSIHVRDEGSRSPRWRRQNDRGGIEISRVDSPNPLRIQLGACLGRLVTRKDAFTRAGFQGNIE